MDNHQNKQLLKIVEQMCEPVISEIWISEENSEAEKEGNTVNEQRVKCNDLYRKSKTHLFNTYIMGGSSETGCDQIRKHPYARKIKSIGHGPLTISADDNFGRQNALSTSHIQLPGGENFSGTFQGGVSRYKSRCLYRFFPSNYLRKTIGFPVGRVKSEPQSWSWSWSWVPLPK